MNCTNADKKGVVKSAGKFAGAMRDSICAIEKIQHFYRKPKFAKGKDQKLQPNPSKNEP
jgi:hypothetical protein